MNSTNPTKISPESYLLLIEKRKELGFAMEYLPEKHQLEISDQSEWLAKIMLPWNSFPDENGNLKLKDDHHLGIVMIRAGIASTGYFHNGAMLDHKVFRAYMIRQKQGKSQIKYLKTKGKSRAGSRLRLGESERFFEEINTRLQSYADEYPIDMWGISCAKTLFPYFFESEPGPPFSKKDELLFSIPFHVQHPGLEALEAIHKKLNQIHVMFSESGSRLLSESEKKEDSNSDDW